MLRRKPPETHVSHCPLCDEKTIHFRFADGTWTLRITVMPDEHFYLTHLCANCNKWEFTRLSHPDIVDLYAKGVRVDDLSLVDPAICRHSIDTPTADVLFHMYWLANHADSTTVQTVILCAVDRILGRPEHPAGGEL